MVSARKVGVGFDATDAALAAGVALMTAWMMALMSTLGVGARGGQGGRGAPGRWVPGQQSLSWSRRLVRCGTKIAVYIDRVSLVVT